MKILFTGGSSFTGLWFVESLVEAGHDVVAILRGTADQYEGVRQQRVEKLKSLCHCVAETSFGDDNFMDLAASTDWDLFCHHAADVTDYKSEDFNTTGALENNTRNLRAVLTTLREQGCKATLLTGSVFECDEGAGSQGLPAFSPYGLSKALTAEMFRYFAGSLDMQVGKFVIPNPFGPFEEPRFTAYLVRTWKAGKAAGVNTPAYVRDNIHVSLLAKVYADFAAGLNGSTPWEQINPSGYAESQGAFAERFAREMRPRLDLDCGLDLAVQTEFSEPTVRINTDLPDIERLGWCESTAWDELADYYRKLPETL